jgi:hypothetical protein
VTSSSAWSEDQIDTELERLARLTSDLADEIGVDPRAIEALTELLSRLREPRVPVVILGEVSRGKSTLINALLGQELLPEDFRASTSTWIQISHGETFTATALVEEESGKVGPYNVVTPQDLAVYICADGNSARTFGKRHGRSARVLMVDIALPAQILESGLELLDTPGVGGLRPAHRVAALAALRQADAVIFVTKPGEPLSKSELLLLAQAVDRVSACVLVQTHDDQAPDGEATLRESLVTLADPAQWKAALGDAERAQELAQRFASVPGVSVSAMLALRAAPLAEGNTRRGLLTDSNLPMLREILDRDIVAHGRSLHRRNIKRLMEVLHHEIRGRARELIQIYEGGAAAAAVIAERQARITKWQQHNGQFWRQDYDAACETLLQKVAEHARSAARELDNEYRSSFRDMSRDAIDDAIKKLLEEPDSVLIEMLDMVDAGIGEATSRIRSLFVADGLGGGYQHTDRGGNEISSSLDKPAVGDQSRFDSDDVRSMVLGGMAGVGVSTAATAVLTNAGLVVGAAAMPIFWPFIIGAGIFVGLNHLRRRQDKNVEAAIRVLDTVRHEIVTTAYERAHEALVQVKDKVAMEISTTLQDIERQVRSDEQELADVARMPAGQREQRTAEATTDIERADELDRKLADIPAA